MALPDSAVVQVGTQIVLADSTDYSPTAANNLGTRTDQIDLTSVANAAARQSEKVDLGASRAFGYNVMAVLEFAVAPGDGVFVDFYWAPSNSGTAGTNNPGGVSGTDSAYTGTTSASIEESVLQLSYIGSFSCSNEATTTVQLAQVGTFAPQERYGSLVVFNNSGQSLVSDAVEMAVSITPLDYVVID